MSVMKISPQGKVAGMAQGGKGGPKEGGGAEGAEEAKGPGMLFIMRNRRNRGRRLRLGFVGLRGWLIT